MREIKFRAFGASGKMIEWDELKKLHAATIFWESEHYHIMQYTGLKDNTLNLTELYEDDIINKNGELVGNKHENRELLEDSSNFLIQGLCTKIWEATNKEAMDRGCRYTK